ncbi:hypothetical protein LCGC14_2887440, partial [marine sediment metagenome]
AGHQGSLPDELENQTAILLSGRGELHGSISAVVKIKRLEVTDD